MHQLEVQLNGAYSQINHLVETNKKVFQLEQERDVKDQVASAKFQTLQHKCENLAVKVSGMESQLPLESNIPNAGRNSNA